MLSRARALYYEFQFSMIGFPWYISFLLLFMSILVEVLLLEKGNHFTKKLSLPYAQAFKTDVIFSLTKRTRLQFIIFIMKIIIFIIIFIMKRDRGIFFNAVASR